MSELLDVFIGESRENLESASQELLAIHSSGPTSERVDKIFRDLHTIKGSSDLFDIKPLTQLAHAAEDLLDAVRAKEVMYTDEIGELLLEALDLISTWFDELEMGTQSIENWKPLSSSMGTQLRAFIVTIESSSDDAGFEQEDMKTTGTGISDAPHIDVFDSFDDHTDILLLSKSDSSTFYYIDYKPDEACFFRGEDPINVVLSLPGLHTFKIEAPLLSKDADIYQCVLNIKALVDADANAIAQHMAYYEQQYSLHSICRVSLQQQCKGKVFACIEKINDDVLNNALTENQLSGDSSALKSVANLLLASEEHDELSRSVLTLFASSNDLAFLRSNEPTSSAIGGKDTDTSSFVNDTLSTHEHELLSQQMRLMNSEFYNSETMYPSIATVVEKILHTKFDSEEALKLALNGALEVKQMQANETVDETASEPADELVTTVTSEKQEDTQSAVKTERQAVKMLKVDQTKIDDLMDIVGELTVAKNSLPYLAKQAELQGANKELSKQLKAHYSIVNRLTESLQSAVLQIRMVPVSHVFQRYPRLVRDLSRKLEKKIELHMQGEDTEFDKNLIESLSEPLIHLLRNSIDHGIEAPNERIAAGKPEVGRIDLIAMPHEDNVIIEIRDDGKGIDPNKIKLLAFQKGIISESQLESLDDKEALQLIFAAGFSTSEEVSDLSGRGVGMDAVKTMVAQANGTIEMHSEIGVGTTFKLLLPQTMSVNRVMMFEMGNQMFGVSMDSVLETVKVPSADIQKIRNESVLTIRDKLIPLCDLRVSLGFDTGDEKEEHSILVVASPLGEFGLIIDKFHEGIDVIQKPLEGVLAGYSHFCGTALLGDGRVLLIINVPEVLATCL